MNYSKLLQLMNQDGEQLTIEIELQIKKFCNKNNYKKKIQRIKKNQMIKKIKGMIIKMNRK